MQLVPTYILFTRSVDLSFRPREIESDMILGAGEQSQYQQVGLEAPQNSAASHNVLFFFCTKTPGCLINPSLARLPENLSDQGALGRRVRKSKEEPQGDLASSLPLPEGARTTQVKGSLA